MLTQISAWAEHAGMVLDIVLLVRILALRLRSTYVFITMFALLSILYDGVELWTGSDSAEFRGVWYLSKFIYAVAFPLAAWDVFEEAKSSVEKVRKLAMSRMLTSLLFILFWGLLIAAFTGSDSGDAANYSFRLSLFVWTGSIASALAFLWVMRRGIRTHKWELPWNTMIWFRYFQWLLVIEAINCIWFLVFPLVHDAVPGAVDVLAKGSDVLLQVFAMVVTAWCVYKLRSVPSDASDVPVNVKS